VCGAELPPVVRLQKVNSTHTTRHTPHDTHDTHSYIHSTHRNSTPLLCQLRLAALGHIRELVFVSSTPREWHQLASVVTADPPHLRSLVVRASYALSAISRSVLQRIATANQSLRCLCLRGLGDLNEIPDIISTLPRSPDMQVLSKTNLFLIYCTCNCRTTPRIARAGVGHQYVLSHAHTHTPRPRAHAH
jgi:hypothetical protein